MKINWNIVSFLCNVITFVILFFVFDNRGGSTHTETNTVKVYDSTKKTPPPVAPVILVSTQTVAVPAGIDTAALKLILENYFAIKTYSQSFRDTNIVAELFDSICQNGSKGMKLNYKLLQPVRTTITTTNTNTKAQNGLYIGGFAAGSKSGMGAGPQISFLTKKQVIFNYGFDALNKLHQVGAQIKIR